MNSVPGAISQKLALRNDAPMNVLVSEPTTMKTVNILI
jgi:hypothetical protein